ncbi:MAG: MraY family glycosyltransferase [Xanthobacteraceae bacterium]
MTEHPSESLTTLAWLASTALLAALLSAAAIIVLRPWLARVALARPNARSSHRLPTPQGGGIAVVAAALALSWVSMAIAPHLLAPDARGQFLAASAGALLLMGVGWLDDVRPLPVAARLAAQCLAVTAVLVALPHDLKVVPVLPGWTDRVALFIGALWFVNIVNFMDGIDWMVVAEIVPLTAAILLIGPAKTGWVPALASAAMLGAIVGFAPFNKPVASLFLGDVGSLPIGLLLGWLLLQVAAAGEIVAAVILPLYFVADATLTLARRLARGERIWEAHRSHFYQRATDAGLSVAQVIARVFAVNVMLAGLALVSAQAQPDATRAAALATAVLLVGGLLWHFHRSRP